MLVIARYLLTITLLSATFVLSAQMVGADALRYKNFKYHDKPPKYLLSKKSAVFISVPPSGTDSRTREDWKSFSAVVHDSFKSFGVDAVAYFYFDDLFANAEVNKSFADQLTKRQFKYVILVEHTRSSINPDLDNYYKITIVPFNKENSFVDAGANAWKVEGPSLSALLRNMGKNIYKQEMKFSNFLQK